MKQASLWDRVGIGISGFCAVHCLFFPLVIAILPLWPVAGSIHHWTHPVLFVLIVPTVFFAVRHSKEDSGVSFFLYSGMIVIGAAWLLHDWIGLWGEALVTLAGSLLLITGHWKNYKNHQKHLTTPTKK